MILPDCSQCSLYAGDYCISLLFNLSTFNRLVMLQRFQWKTAPMEISTEMTGYSNEQRVFRKSTCCDASDSSTFSLRISYVRKFVRSHDD